MSLVRSVRAGGNGSLLWPKDCTSIEDVPQDLVRAISHANRILDWQENLPSDEIPPFWMWPNEDLLTDWFEDVERKREERFSSSGDETVPMDSNELTKGRFGR